MFWRFDALFWDLFLPIIGIIALNPVRKVRYLIWNMARIIWGTQPFLYTRRTSRTRETRKTRREVNWYFWILSVQFGLLCGMHWEIENEKNINLSVYGFYGFCGFHGFHGFGDSKLLLMTSPSRLNFKIFTAGCQSWRKKVKKVSFLSVIWLDGPHKPFYQSVQTPFLG